MCLTACKYAVLWHSCSLTRMHRCMSEEVFWSTCCVCYVTYVKKSLRYG